jgi:hypothetical protein
LRVLAALTRHFDIVIEISAIASATQAITARAVNAAP